MRSTSARVATSLRAHVSPPVIRGAVDEGAAQELERLVPSPAALRCMRASARKLLGPWSLLAGLAMAPQGIG
jgi:hypothetical protein